MFLAFKIMCFPVLQHSSMPANKKHADFTSLRFPIAPETLGRVKKYKFHAQRIMGYIIKSP
jgi:hypothetical protein